MRRVRRRAGRRCQQGGHRRLAHHALQQRWRGLRLHADSGRRQLALPQRTARVVLRGRGDADRVDRCPSARRRERRSHVLCEQVHRQVGSRLLQPRGSWHAHGGQVHRHQRQRRQGLRRGHRHDRHLEFRAHGRLDAAECGRRRHLHMERADGRYVHRV
jgi:hypothetical protein